MATSGAQEIKKEEALMSFSIISYKTRLRVLGMLVIFGIVSRAKILFKHEVSSSNHISK